LFSVKQNDEPLGEFDKRKGRRNRKTETAISGERKAIALVDWPT